MMYTVYALKSRVKEWIYVGMTINKERIYKDHNAGYNTSTKAYKPFDVIYEEVFQTRIEARSKEKYLKSGVGKRFLKDMTKI